MVDSHLGYPGSMNSADLALWAPNVGAAQYSVEAANDGKVVGNSIGDRGVTVKAGKIMGDGVMDLFGSDTNLNFAAVTPGSPDRWDMVVLRRTWNATPGASTSVYTIIQGNTNRSLPSRNTLRGVVTDQPMALCRIKADNTQVQEIVDLRCWAHNGGVYALDDLVKSYLDHPGTHLTIKGQTWIRRIVAGTGTNTDVWTKTGDIEGINLLGVAGPLYGAGGMGNIGAFMQAGTLVGDTDGAGYGRVTFPLPFPNGLISVVAMNADDWAIGSAGFVVGSGNPAHAASALGTTYDWVYAVYGYDTPANTGPMVRKINHNHRINWIAIGW